MAEEKIEVEELETESAVSATEETETKSDLDEFWGEEEPVVKAEAEDGEADESESSGEVDTAEVKEAEKSVGKTDIPEEKAEKAADSEKKEASEPEQDWSWLFPDQEKKEDAKPAAADETAANAEDKKLDESKADPAPVSAESNSEPDFDGFLDTNPSAKEFADIWGDEAKSFFDMAVKFLAGKNLPETAADSEKEDVEAKFAEREQALADREKVIAEAEYKVKLREFDSAVESAHPNWRTEVMADPKFMEWLKGQGKQIQQTVATTDDPKDAIFVIDKYKSELGTRDAKVNKKAAILKTPGLGKGKPAESVGNPESEFEDGWNSED